MKTTLTNDELIAIAEGCGPRLCTKEAGDGPDLLRRYWAEIRAAIEIGLRSPDRDERRRTVLAVHGLRNWYSTMQAGDPADLEKAAKVAEDIGGLEEVRGNLYRFYGDTMARRNNEAEAERGYSTTIGIYERNRERIPNVSRWIASCTRGLGDIAFRAGDYSLAQQRFRGALYGFRTLPEPDMLGVANCLRRVGNVAYMQGFLYVAKGYYLEALNIYKTLGPVPDYADCLVGIARATYNISEHDDDTGDAIDTAVKLFEALGDKLGLARALAWRAGWYKNLNAPEAAAADQQRADALYAELNLPGPAVDVIR